MSLGVIEFISHTGLEYILGRIIQDFMKSMHQIGLSIHQIHALLHIYHSQDGECQLSEIGGLADSSKPAVSQLVDRLVQQGLAERTEDPQDRRKARLRLTAKSRKLIQSAVTSNHFLAKLMNFLPVEQRKIVHTAIGYLTKAGQQIQFSQT